jgi:hypothetical protein
MRMKQKSWDSRIFVAEKVYNLKDGQFIMFDIKFSLQYCHTIDSMKDNFWYIKTTKTVKQWIKDEGKSLHLQ